MLRNFARTAFSVARIRFFTVSRSIWNRPFRVEEATRSLHESGTR
jgi:hypothetical protein